ADGDARIVRALHAHRDLVHAANLERAVMEAGALGGEQREVVMIGRAAHERDDAGTAIGQLHPEHACVEVRHPLEVAGEEQDVAEPTRPRLEAIRTAAHAGAQRVARAVELQGRIARRRLAGLRPDVDEVAVGIAYPQAAFRRAAWRVHLAHTRAAQRLARRLDPRPGPAARDVVQALLRTAVEQHGLALEGRGPQTHGAVAAGLVDQPDAGIELLADRLVCDLARVMQQR